MDEHEAFWDDFWKRFDDRKKELVFEEGYSWEDADTIAREEFDLDD
mgnify:CR=1 FL=1